MTQKLALLLATILVFAALPTVALAGGRIVYRLGLDPPKEVLDAPKNGRTAFTELAAQQLRKRFEAAAVKEFEFRTTSASTLVVETGWDHDRGWMEALLTAPGKLEVRRVTPERPDWLGLASQLPADVEVRGDDLPYLWSSKRSSLSAFLARITLPNGALKLFPEDGGYRSVSLGEVVATEKQVKAARTRQSRMGAPFVAVEFVPAVGASLAAAHVSGVEKVALVLDGELVAFTPAKAFLDQQTVQLSVPHGAVADSREERDLWVRQVAGRLAAPLPIAIAVLKE